MSRQSSSSYPHHNNVLTLMIILSSFYFLFTASADRGEELLSKVQKDALVSHVTALQENVAYNFAKEAYNTRSAHHQDATDTAVNYIKRMLSRSERLLMTEQNVGGIRNVIAMLPKKQTSISDRAFIICAHYDTHAVREPDWNPLSSKAPGANKNGTGVAALLEIANILSQYEYDHDLIFVALGGEELDFQGSHYFIQDSINSGETSSNKLTDTQFAIPGRISAVINLDMIGFNWKSDLVEVITNRDSSWISRALTISNSWYEIGLKIRRTQDEYINISSHKSFWDVGYPAVTLIESSTPWRDSQNYDVNPYYHTFNDTVDKVNFNLVSKVTQLVLVTIDNLLTNMFQPDRALPQITVDLPSLVKQNPVQVTGTYKADYPIEIVFHPSEVVAKLDKVKQTYAATVPLSPGANNLIAIARFPLGANSVRQSVVLDEAFIWKDVNIYPNPVRVSNQTEFRVEGNLEITDMRVNVFDVKGSLIKRIDGVSDRIHSHIWRTWWNQQTAYGLAVSAGIYICQISVVAKGETYTILRKLAVMR